MRGRADEDVSEADGGRKWQVILQWNFWAAFFNNELKNSIFEVSDDATAETFSLLIDAVIR